MADLSLFRARGFQKRGDELREQAREERRLGFAERQLSQGDERLDIDRTLAELQGEQLKYQMERDENKRKADQLQTLRDRADLLASNLVDSVGASETRDPVMRVFAETRPVLEALEKQIVELGGQPGLVRRTEQRILNTPTAMDVAKLAAKAAGMKSGAETSGRITAETAPGAVDAKADAARREAEAAAAGQFEGTRRQFNAIAELDNPEAKAALMQKFGFKEEQSADSFIRALAMFEAIRNDPDADPEVVSFITKRLQKLTEDSGTSLSVQFGDDGRVVGLALGPSGGGQGGTASGGLTAGMTAEQTNRQVATTQSIDSTLSVLDGLLQELEKNPTAFGAGGSIRGFFQNMVGAAASGGDIISEVTGGRVDLNSYAKALGNAFNVKVFDEQLSRTELLENVLAVELAKLRSEVKGERDVRAFNKLYEDAKKDVDLTGIFGSEDVKSRLTAIKREFLVELGNQRLRAFGQSTGGGEGEKTGGGDKVIRFDSRGNRAR